MTTASVRASYAFSPGGAVRMWQRNATIGRKTVLTTLTPRFLEAIAYLAIMGLGLGTYLTTVDGVDYVDFIAPGVAASTVMFGAVIETTYNSFVRIHVRRVFEAVITTPLSLADVVVGEYLWAATRAVLYGVVFLIVMACFGLVHTPMALLLPAGLRDRRPDLRGARHGLHQPHHEHRALQHPLHRDHHPDVPVRRGLLPVLRTCPAGPRSSAGACPSRTWSPPPATSPSAAPTG